MTVTTHRPAPLPHATVPVGKVVGKAVPPGAAKMQSWYIDVSGKRQRPGYLVPVDAEDQLTDHIRHTCRGHIEVDGERMPCDQDAWLAPGDPSRFCPDHGCQLETTQPTRRVRARTVLAAAVRANAKSAAPWLVPAATLAGDVVLRLADAGPGGAFAAVPAAAGSYFVTKRVLTARAIRRGRVERGQRTGRRIRDIHRRAIGGAAVAGEVGLWSAALAVLDGRVAAVVAAAGAIRWAVGAKPWWDRIESRRCRAAVPDLLPVSSGAAEPQPEPPDPVQLHAVTRWAALIGCPGGPLAGTELVEFRRLPGCDVRATVRTRRPNWAAKVVAVVEGSINMRETRPTLLGRIAAAYGCTYADVAFTADESDLSVGWLRVQPDNQLAETKLWPGPEAANDWRHGRSRIGRFDDSADIVYHWWTKTGAAHDLIGGSSGSGKSELVAQLILASLHSDGLVLDWVGDPQGGQSYGVLKEAVDWFARDKTEITLMLLAALKEMLRRNDELAAQNIKTWRPTRAMPLLVITLDEVQAYIEDPIILELVTKLIGQGRKCGIKMRLITQIIAAYNLGGSTYIKDQSKIGQTLTFRSETDIAGRSAVEGDSPIDPTALPKVWGPNTCAAGETTAGLMFVQGISGRDVYGRADYTGEDMNVWLVDSTGASSVSPGVFGPEAQLESGVLWGDRKERARRMLLAGRADEDLLSGGKAVDLVAAASVSSTTGEPVRLTPPAAPAAAPKARDTVLAAARAHADGNGIITRDALVTAVKGKMADGTRDKALTDLVADGSLRRIRNGVYEVPGGPQARQQLEIPATAEPAP